MQYQWFRLYGEFAKDAKVQSMSEAMQRRLIMFFCLQSTGELDTLTDQELAFALGIDDETFHETLVLFRQKGFVDENRQILNWDKRQYKSDTSTSRVKKYREKSTAQQRETFQKRFCNGDETVPESESESDTESKRYKNIYISIPQNADFDEFWATAVKRVGKDAAKRKYEIARRTVPKDDIHGPWKAFNEIWAKKKNTPEFQYVPHPATWLHQGRWADDIPKPVPNYTPLGVGG